MVSLKRKELQNSKMTSGENSVTLIKDEMDRVPSPLVNEQWLLVDSAMGKFSEKMYRQKCISRSFSR